MCVTYVGILRGLPFQAFTFNKKKLLFATAKAGRGSKTDN